MRENIEIIGAREHNLKDVDVTIPRNKLVVFTGLSGSGKSSLAFDTIYAEGQRRYLETFSSYARQFLGGLERPDVEKIDGLSPVIAIEQKTVSRNPRSTVGTITEIYDFLRLLFARIGVAHSPVTGNPMVKFTDNEILHEVTKRFQNRKVIVLAPLVKGRKGHYRELFARLIKQGYTKVRVDGEVRELVAGMKLDRYRIHDIQLVIDKLGIKSIDDKRLFNTLQDALSKGGGEIFVLDEELDHLVPYSRNLMCPESGLALADPEPNLFSFNSPYGACTNCNGLGTVAEVDLTKVLPDLKLSVRKGGIAPLGKARSNWIFTMVGAILQKHGFSLDTPVGKIPEPFIRQILDGTNDELKGGTEEDSYTLSSFEGVITFLQRQYEDDPSPSLKRWIEGFMQRIECPQCTGGRLRQEALFFKLDGLTLPQLAAMDIQAFLSFISELPKKLGKQEKEIAREVIKEIEARTGFLIDVGLEYLILNRSAATLSGGEAQRIRLATQIGTELTNVLYILDEPSIGLHQRDNMRLINSLKKLRDTGNSVIVVEHDREMIEACDVVVDIGPGAGTEGGAITFCDHPDRLKDADTITARFLSGKDEIEIPEKRRKGSGKKLKISGCRGNNLKDVTLELPLGVLVGVTGVSGSGKSTLINQTLHRALLQHFEIGTRHPLKYSRLSGVQHIDKVIAIDQAPIGRTPRSNPATYTGVFSDIRNLFAQLPEAVIRGYKPGRFSFNVKGGRCETCKGGGMRVIEMNFLPDVYVACETCGGKRYNRETLQVRYKGKSISDVLEMRIDKAMEFFEHIPQIHRKIKTLHDVGLGYVSLGQSSTTLSGGEAQRIKLASELARKDTGKTLYIMDEPTTGLHFEDIRVLLKVINQLVERGNTMVIIEHNLDVIKVADWVIDVGPEGGQEGGQIVFAGNPEELSAYDNSHTGRFLKMEMNR